MFLPSGYLSYHQAASLVPDDAEFDWGSHDPKGERLGGALANGDMIGHGVVIGAEWNGDVPELGEIRELRPEAWRMPGARDAVLGKNPTGSLHQDGWSFAPIISRDAFFAWRKTEIARLSPPAPEQSVSQGVPDLSSGVHALPSGYVAFDQISRIAHVWAQNGTIDADLLLLLDPPDTDSMTQALATGSLPTYGISKRTGEIIVLPPSIWRMEVGGCVQSIWAIGGSDVLTGPDGELCLPVVTRADLARAFQATTIPPEPEERPEGWQPGVAIARVSSRVISADRVGTWMTGYAEGFKACSKILKRDEAVRLAREKFGCTTRQAEAAFEALPYPDLRNPPRVSTG